MAKPCDSKLLAFSIWSPRLQEAGSGIKRLGFLRARSSQIALAPALEITISARAKRSFKSSLTYSNCLYPCVFNKRLSTLSFPQTCTIWKSSNSFGRASRTKELTPAAPRLPPITKIIGFPDAKPQRSNA